MKNISNNDQNGSLHALIVIICTCILVAAIGYVFWSNIIKPKTLSQSSQQTNSAKKYSSKEQIEKCLEEFDKKNPPMKGWADHRDKSECYPDIISLDKVSLQQKDEQAKNSQVLKEAGSKKDDRVCDKIKGTYYTVYPPNMTKVMMNTEDETRKMCRSLVSSKIKQEKATAERLSQYFELPGWGIKLRWKEQSDKVTYYAVGKDSQGLPTSYEFSTKNTENNNECPLQKGGRLGAISRQKDPSKVGKGVRLQTTIGEYHYFDTNPQLMCIADNSIYPSSINQTRTSIRSMITGAQSQPSE